MRLRNLPHASLAGGPIMLRKGWPHDPAKLRGKWPHDPANWQVWVGSANLTNGGLQNEGELVAELVFPAGDPALVSVGGAFERECLRGKEITQEFLDKYREAPRTYSFRGTFRRRPGAPPPAPPSRTQRMFVVTASAHYSDDGPVGKRIGALLGACSRSSCPRRRPRRRRLRPRVARRGYRPMVLRGAGAPRRNGDVRRVSPARPA
jgi:hypothetical protein